MEQLDSEVPKASPIRSVVIVYNLKKGLPAAAPDAEAEYDSIETVQAIRVALETGGLSVGLAEADETLASKLRAGSYDIAFNIAEGVSGRGREAQAPAIFNMVGLPFTGSDETALCISLDKALTKRLAASWGVRVPRGAVLGPEDTALPRGLHYPAIVKPNAEGSSKGISGAAVAADAKGLRAILAENFRLYGTEMLVEEFLPGREFTLGLLGNGKDLRAFEPMEVVYDRATDGPYCVYSYPVKQNFREYLHYECPAKLEPAQSEEMKAMARAVFRALGCRDLARADFRLGADGRPRFIEINPLPGLAPGYSDYPMLAEFQGVPYGELVRGILDAAAARLRRCVAWEVRRYA